jgi:hypothetical protein
MVRDKFILELRILYVFVGVFDKVANYSSTSDWY